jgi:REP element-mobilizing transposase RayT
VDDEDRQRFLDVLIHVVSRFHLLLHAYCLMDNHFHLVVETPDANLSKAMRQLNGVYTQAFNRRHGRIGNVLQGRFKAILVDQDRYLLELCRNVAPNPVRSITIRKPIPIRGRATKPPATRLHAILSDRGLAEQGLTIYCRLLITHGC